MKKITGILGIVLLAVTMFVNANNINSNNTTDTNLISIIGLSSDYTEDCYDMCDAEYPEDYELFAACMYGCGE